ncbi:MAG: hypothetical protein ABWZ39_02695 [Pseudomonas caspiana]
MFTKIISLILALAALAAGPAALAHNDSAAPAGPAPIARDTATGAALTLKPPRSDSIMYYISTVDGNGDLSYPDDQRQPFHVPTRPASSLITLSALIAAAC